MIYLIIIVIVFLLVLLLLNIKISLIIQNSNVAVSINGIKIKPKIKKLEEDMKKERFKITFKKAWRLKGDLWPPIRSLLLKTSVELNLNFQYGLSDAAATAVLYGSANSLIYGLEPILKWLFKSFSGCYSILPDFNKEGLDYTLKLHLKIKVLYILIFVFKILLVLRNYNKYIKDKGGVVNA